MKNDEPLSCELITDVAFESSLDKINAQFKPKNQNLSLGELLLEFF